MASKHHLVAVLVLVAAASLAGPLSSQTPVGPYPTVTAPPENPITEAKRVLGKILFWDEQLSSDNTTACGTCHFPELGGTDPRSNDPNSISPGADGMFNTLDDVHGSKGLVRSALGGALLDDGTFFPDVQVTGRKAPSMMDAMFAPESFWDGRATSQFVDPVSGAVVIASGGALESQAVGPPVSDVEMAHQGRPWVEILAKLQTVKPLRLATNVPPDMTIALALNTTYPALFNAAFGTSAVTAPRVAMAIATYERTLVSNQTPFDAFNAGVPGALTPAQQAGLLVFQTSARCDLCHTGAMLTDDDFHNIGHSDPASDPARMDVTGNPADFGASKVPSLRNVGLREATGLFRTGTGSGFSIDAVVNFYESGGNFTGPGDNLDPLMQPLPLSSTDKLNLIDFLRNALTDPRAANNVFPFDRPTLHAELVGTPAENPVGTGAGGAPDLLFGQTPVMIANQPPNLQNPFFTIGIGNAIGGSVGFLVLGAAPFFPEFFAGIDLQVSQFAPFATVPVFLSGPFGVPGAGFGSVTAGISSNPFLVGISVNAQWLVWDGIAPHATDGVTMTILP